MMKKMNLHTKGNRRLLVTAICVAALGALSQTVDVQAATDNTNTSGVSESSSIPESSKSDTPAPTSSNGADSSKSGNVGTSSEGNSGTESDAAGSNTASSNTASSNTTDSNNSGSDASAAGKAETAPVVESNPVDASADGTENKDQEPTGDSTDTVDPAAADAKGSDTKAADEKLADDSKLDDSKVDDSKVAAPVVTDETDPTIDTKITADTSTNKIHTEAHIEVTNSSGKAETTSNEVKGANSVIEDNADNQYSAVLTYTDNTPKGKDSTQSSVYPSILLPSYFENKDTAANIVVDQQGLDAATWEANLLKNAGLPANTKISYKTDQSWDYGKTLQEWGSDFDLTKVTGIKINYGANTADAMPANSTYTVKIPLTVKSNDTSKSGVSYVYSSDAGGSSVFASFVVWDGSNRMGAFRIGEQADPEKPVETPNPDAPVVTTNPDATETMTAAERKTNGAHTEAHIDVDNGKGVTSTQTTDTKGASSTIAGSDDNKYSAVFTYTDKNTSATGPIAYNSPTLFLPSYFTDADSAADLVVDQGTAKDFTEWQNKLLANAGLPANSEITYKVAGSTGFTSLDQLGSDVKVSDIQGIQINYTRSFMPKDATYTLSVPLKVASNDAKSTNLSYVGVSDGRNSEIPSIYGTVTPDQWLYTRTAGFRIAEDPTDTSISNPISMSNAMEGTYPVVTEQKSNVHYTNVNPDIEGVPTVADGDITHSTIVTAKPDTDTLYAGEVITVSPSALDKIQAIVKDQGYSLLLDNNGTVGYGNYVYTITNGENPIIDGRPDATETDPSSLASNIYITVRQLINTKNTDLTVGQTWKNSDNLADVTITQDKATPATVADLTTAPTAANHVTTTISDPNGILDKNGKATKDGTFTVTYSMKDGNYTISKTATVTVKAAAPSHHSGGNGNNNNSGTTTDNNGGSTTNGNGDNGSSTGTDTTDPDTPVVSPSDPNDVDVPVVSPNEIPDVSEITGNNTNDNNATTDPTENNNGGSTVTATNNNTVATTTANTSNGQTTPVYTVGNNASGVLTGYTPTSSTQIAKAATVATFPQTGDANDSKLQVIGAMILSMMASVTGFAFGKKRHAEKA